MSHTHYPQQSPPLRHAPTNANQEAIAGEALFNRGQWLPARDRFLEAIRLEPNRGLFHFAAAMCIWASGQIDEAGAFLQSAVRLDPKHGPAHAWLGEWYLVNGMVDAALSATAIAVQIDPNNPDFMLSRAWALEVVDPDGAWDLVQRLIARATITPSTARLYGRLAGRYGKEAQALEIILRLLASGVPSTESALYFTAAELLDRAGRYDEAFSLAQKANASNPAEPYHPFAQQNWNLSVTQYFTRQRMGTLPRATIKSDKPVFIVGMPRSGTSLVEQILAAHPAVHGAGELDFIHRSFLGGIDMLRAKLSDFPACFDKITTAHLDGMADLYLEPFIALKPDAIRIIDKMPLNFIHLGLINLLFPGARIIHCRRDPLDTCVSCFLTPLNNGYPFTRDLTHLGHYYKLYDDLMKHWKVVNELPMLEVAYEDLVTQPETESRRMVEFLGLGWDDRCLNFHKSRQPCATASVMQVRRPVYKTSVARWRHYEKHLSPLKAALAGN